MYAFNLHLPVTYTPNPNPNNYYIIYHRSHQKGNRSFGLKRHVQIQVQLHTSFALFATLPWAAVSSRVPNPNTMSTVCS